MNPDTLQLTKDRSPPLEGFANGSDLNLAKLEMDKAQHVGDAHTVVIRLLRCPLQDVLTEQHPVEPAYLQHLVNLIVQHRLKKGV